MSTTSLQSGSGLVGVNSGFGVLQLIVVEHLAGEQCKRRTHILRDKTELYEVDAEPMHTLCPGVQ